jgi:polar amino acid transport system substrate-binding protein
VRWTEKRNMQAFVELVAQKKLNLKKITSHVFDFKDALKAYELVVDKYEPFTGILLKYDAEKKISSRVELKQKMVSGSEPAIGFIGAGSYASNVLLPAMKGHCNFIGIANNRSNTSRNIGDKYGFGYCTNETQEIFSDKKINIVFIATRHDSHAEYVKQALQSHKNVFVEKPLCLYEEELEEIKNAFEKSDVQLMVGFNRRFSPLVQKTVAHFKNLNQPVAIQYRINAGIVPPNHWIHDPTIGGGRIIGEVCHFIDLVTYLAQSKITSLSANAMQKSHDHTDTLVINASLENGSVASLSYLSNGNKEVSKEYIEVFGSGQVAIIDDFKELSLYGKSVKHTKLPSQDKGHKQEIKLFLENIRKGGNPLIPFEEIYHSTYCTFKIAESVKMNGSQIRIQ